MFRLPIQHVDYTTMRQGAPQPPAEMFCDGTFAFHNGTYCESLLASGSPWGFAMSIPSHWGDAAR